jgi:hypothetical protein
MMTEQQIPASAGSPTVSPLSRRSNGANPAVEADRWMRWVRFGGVMMAVLGAFAVIEGLAALLAPTTFLTVDGSVLAINLSGWAWVHIIIGALVFATGLALLGKAPEWARGVGIGLVALSMLVQLAWLPAYPIWSIIMVVLDVIVLYALIVTWSGQGTAGR